MTSPLPEPRDEAGILFRLLGPMEVIGADGRPRAVVGRQQSVLAALLLAANQVVSVDQLVDAVWEDDPPLTARAQVQFCISALRRMFLRLRLQARIDTQAPGYKIRLEPGQLDSQVFEAEAAAAHRLRAQGQLPEAADRLRAALNLWSGDPLDGASASLHAKTLRLVELRKNVLRECIDVELELHRHGELVGELQTLVAAHSLDEGFRAQLMTALARSGRASDALEVYREGRAKAVAELGLEPGGELRRLEAAILESDGEPAGPAPLSTSSTPPSRELAPRQLPADIADFAGRDQLVSRLEQLLAPKTAPGDRRALAVVSLFGMPGVGKSALAVHAAHRIAPHAFPDGQLYASLGGSTESPEAATEVLARFLRALGVAEDAVPQNPIERADLYRTLLADRQVLVVLDDAGDEGQLTPLLPGSPSCAVLISTRRPLTGLAGAHQVGVDLLPDEDITAVLSGMIGDDRQRAEPDQLKELADVVQGLPLAARILGARLAAHPHWSLASMVRRLHQASSPLDQLQYGDWSIRESLLSAYRTLNPNEAKVLQALATADDPSLPGETLTQTTDPAVLDLLDGLVCAQLLDPAGTEVTDDPGYRLHPLVRAVAEEQAIAAARRRKTSRESRHADASRRLAADRRPWRHGDLPPPGTSPAATNPSPGTIRTDCARA